MQHLAHPLEAVYPPETNSPELFGEVLVEEAVDHRVGAGARHAKDVTDGVDAAEHFVRHVAEECRAVHHGVEDVERDPADAEDGSDPAEELDGALQSERNNE